MERDMNQRPGGSTETRLKQCDLSVCKAMCCFDGVYLNDGEEARITQVVQENPDVFSFLPDEFIVDGYWRGTSSGRKTAISPHEHQVPDFPAHFTHTKCVFNLPDGRCSLQAFATERGEHPWTYKPKACYMHPLRRKGSELVPPPIDRSDDPQNIDEDYPGFITYTLCGRHWEDGLPWREVLSEEIACFQRGRVSDGTASEEDR